jgi:2-oxoglutarate dehydrogenase complex dehydrogenase (E1) component-like enzyme
MARSPQESSGLNAGYVGALLEQYLENPDSVEPAWREVFERARVLELPEVGHAPPEERGPELISVVEAFLREESRP